VGARVIERVAFFGLVVLALAVYWLLFLGPALFGVQ
jgi:hypothetical protein